MILLYFQRDGFDFINKNLCITIYILFLRGDSLRLYKRAKGGGQEGVISIDVGHRWELHNNFSKF